MNIKTLLLAFRLNTLPAIIGPILVGYVLAQKLSSESFEAKYIFAILIAGLAIQIATNLFNDYVDGVRGADHHQGRLGPDRVTAKALMTPLATRNWGLIFCGIAFLAGIPIVLKTGWVFILLGLLSLGLTYLYTGTRYSLAYTGAADLFVILFFGIFAVWGTYYTLSLGPSWIPVLLGLQVGMMCNNILIINNLRDIAQDKENHKKTLIVRFGRVFGLYEYLGMILLSYFLILLWPESFSKLWAMIFVAPWFIFSLILWDWVRRHEPSKAYNKALKLTGMCHLGFCTSMAVSLILFRKVFMIQYCIHEYSLRQKLNAQATENFISEIIFRDFKKNSHASVTFHNKVHKENILDIFNTYKDVVKQNIDKEYELKQGKKLFINDIDLGLKSHKNMGWFEKSEALKKELETFVYKGFERFKFKVDKKFDFEFAQALLEVYQDIQFIFDFNQSAEQEWLMSLEPLKSLGLRLFFEDPICFHKKTWSDLKQKSIGLIYDMKGEGDSLEEISQIDPVVAIKPTKECVQTLLGQFPKSKFLITNNMGAELDHIMAADWANAFYKKFPDQFWGCGLMTRDFLLEGQDKISSKEVEMQPFVNKSFSEGIFSGYGWGMDAFFSKENWIDL